VRQADPVRTAVPRALRRAAAAALIVAAALDLGATVLAGWRAGAAWPWLLFSETEVAGRPWAWLFRAGFVAADLLVAPAATVLAAVDPPRYPAPAARPMRLAWVALAVFGAASTADELAAMSCVPHVDLGCELPVVSLRAPWVDQAHGLVSVLAVLGVLTSMLAMARATRHHPHRLIIRWAPGWLAAELLATVALGACLLVDGPTGVPQTAEMLVEATWLVLLGRHAIRDTAG
jgi:hypothetical protein